jgi:cytochrome c553
LKQFVLGVVSTLVVIAVGGFLYLRAGFGEVRGDIPPGPLETYLMTSAVHASVRRHAPQVPNPLPPTDANLILGGKRYLDECAGCHGMPGKANATADSLFPPVPELLVVGTRYTEAQVFWVAKHGIGRSGMFANGKWDSDDKLWSIAAFIKRANALPPAVKEAFDKAAASNH